MPLTHQKILHTSRLHLIPLQDEHLPHTMKLDMDPEVMKTVAFGRPFTEDEAKQVHAWLMKSAQIIPGYGCWAGFTRDEGDFVGWWILATVPEPESEAPSSPSESSSDSSDAEEPSPQKPQPGKTEYGFRVSPKFWGKGFAKEGAREMVRHAFEDLGLEEVIGETMTVNAASRAVMAGSGLKHVETFFNTYDTPPAGIEEGEVRYSLKRAEWVESVRRERSDSIVN